MKKGRLLVVGDEACALKLYGRIFADGQYDIRYASSGEEALRKAAHFKPDVVLLDIMMPGIDGYEVCQRLKADKETWAVDVIFISAKGGVSERLEAYAKRATDFLIKPFSAEELLAKVSVILEKKRFFLDLAHTDHLTVIGNRRAFEEHFDIIYRTAIKYRRTFSVAMMDIDNLKEINDTCGHGVGDFIIKEVARRLKENMRQTDVLARIGGDEFAVLMPETDRITTVSVIARLREVIAANLYPAPEDKHSLRITLSIGAAMFPEDAAEKKNLLEQADKAMYLAKRRLRNRANFGVQRY